MHLRQWLIGGTRKSTPKELKGQYICDDATSPNGRVDIFGLLAVRL